ncbi:MAG: hypothetical protein JWO53_361, partial [Chlamydiia bacterium]|nr:hypothetical protein [Chlamydiia bacterium]
MELRFVNWLEYQPFTWSKQLKSQLSNKWKYPVISGVQTVQKVIKVVGLVLCLSATFAIESIIALPYSLLSLCFRNREAAEKKIPVESVFYQHDNDQ